MFCYMPTHVQVGRQPSASGLHTYLMRLREHGWDIQKIVKKLIHAGKDLPEETKCECGCKGGVLACIIWV